MAFSLVWMTEAAVQYASLRANAADSLEARKKSKKAKAGKAEGLFKQVHKCIQNLASNPKHPALQTHEFSSLPHPYENGEKVFEAYGQHRTPGAYRVFWCYGPQRAEITIISITPHP